MDRQYGFSDSVEKELRQSKKSQLISLGILLLLIIGMTIWKTSSRDIMKIQWTETTLSVTDPANAVYTFNLEDLKRLSLREGWDFGTCREGGETGSYKYGIWENEEFGEYRLYAARECSSVILLESDAEKIALSYESDQITRELYDALIPMLEESGYSPETGQQK